MNQATFMMVVGMVFFQSISFLVLWHVVNSPVREVVFFPEPGLCANIQEMKPSDEEEGYDRLIGKLRTVSSELKRQVLKANGAIFPPLLPPTCNGVLKAATYNLWNINPPWPERRGRIVQMFNTLKPDIIGLQEIRYYEGQSQLQQLQSLLPDYPYSAYLEVLKGLAVGKEEGIGILSRYPIVNTTFTQYHSPESKANADTRKCLNALIEIPGLGKINFFVTHFGLDDHEQCTQASNLWRFLNTFPKDIPKIVVGDMNTYFDFEWPVEFLTQGFSSLLLNRLNPCFQSVRAEFLLHGAENYSTLVDIWEENYPVHNSDPSTRWWAVWTADGNTYPNYGDNDPSRPDRIYYAADNLKSCKVIKFGGETFTVNGKLTFPSDHMGLLATFEQIVSKN